MKNKGRIYFDTEDDSRGHFKVGVLKDVDKNLYLEFDDADAMRVYILEHGREVWAHNVQYDIGNLFPDRLTDLEYKITRGVFVKAVYHNNGKYVRFYDSMKLLPLALKEIGDAMGVKKVRVNFRKKNKKQVLLKRCRRDVEILELAVENMEKLFREKFGIKMSYTIGGNALRILKTFYNGDLKLPRQFDELIRRSYFGGRVEIFRIGKIKGKIYEADVNSMYPSVMRDLVFPDWTKMRYSEGRRPQISREGFTFCEVRSDLDVPLLPKKDENGGLTFPNGIFSGTWTNLELRRFQSEGGKITRCYWTVYSRKSRTSIFKDFVDKIYELKRTDGNPYRVLLWKLLLNASYGKFGFRGQVENIMPLNMNKGTFGVVIFGKDRPYCMEERHVSANYQNVAIASYITAAARLRLYNGLQAAKDSLVYCDTDSVFSTVKFADKTDKLGEFSAKGVYPDGEFLLPKLYRVGNKVRAKGMKIRGRKAWYDFRRKGYAVTVRPVKIKTAMRDGQRVNVWKKERKGIASTYTKRISRPDGSTTPIIKS